MASGFTVAGVDIDSGLVPKSYLIDRYPELADTFKQSGLWVVGLNDRAQLGDGTTVSKSSPIQTIAGGSNWKKISTAYNSMSGIKTDNTLWVWGINTSGEGAQNNLASSNLSTPVQTISGGTNWVDVSAGGNHYMALKSDGTLWLWGSNFWGQLGDGTRVNKSSPVQTISAGTNWKYISAGIVHSTAIKTDGTLWLWGRNTYGTLGNGTASSTSSPVQTVSGGTNWKSSFGGAYHTAAIKTDGTLWLWGRGSSGQLGDNTSVGKSSPVQTVSGGSNWKLASCGRYHTAAIKTDGTLWAWGYGGSGQLGDNTITDKSSPVQTVSGGTNWLTTSCNYFSVYALKSDGTLWSWGSNSSGQLGDGTTVSKSSPGQTIAGGANWKSLFTGTARSNSAFIRDDSLDPL